MADNEHPGKADAPPPEGGKAGRSASEWTVSDTRGPLETAEDERMQEADPSVKLDYPDQVPPPANPLDAQSTSEEQAPPKADEPTPSLAAAETPAFEQGAAQPEAAPHDECAAASPAETPRDEPRRPSYWPVAAAIVLGAVVGAGSAYLMYGSVGSGGADPQIAALAARVDALEKRPDASALKQSIADLDRKVAALRQPAAAGATAGNDDALQKQVAALDAKVEGLKAQGRDDQGLQGKIATLEGTLAGMRKDTSSAQASVADVAGQQRSMASEQKLLADRVMVPALAVVADSLVRQIESGEPYATQVAALDTLGADPVKVAVLKQNADKGVASAKTLAARFAPLADQASAAASKPAPDAGFMARMRSGMMSMVSVRAVDDTSGTDLPSRVARIKADLAHDDVAGALATWNALPADAKTKGDDWALLAKAHVEAMGAAQALQHDAIVALGAKKS